MPGRSRAVLPFRAGGKRERTRAQLIEAAAELIAERGYNGTTLDDVAARVGMTRGAIYGNFESREDLFLALVESRWQPIMPELRRGGTLKEQMRLLGKAVAAMAPARQARAVRALEFQLYALTHKKMRSRLSKRNAEIYRAAAKALLEFVPKSELPMPAHQFVCVLHALTDGLLFTRFLNPEAITDEVIVKAFEALAKA